MKEREGRIRHHRRLPPTSHLPSSTGSLPTSRCAQPGDWSLERWVQLMTRLRLTPPARTGGVPGCYKENRHAIRYGVVTARQTHPWAEVSVMKSLPCSASLN